jgi:hypothetical protein
MKVGQKKYPMFFPKQGFLGEQLHRLIHDLDLHRKSGTQFLSKKSQDTRLTHAPIHFIPL